VKKDDLLAALRARSPRQRTQAVEALVRMRNAPLLELRRMAEASRFIAERRCALEVLRRKNDRMLPQLALQGIRHPSENVRRVAVLALVNAGGNSVIARVSPLLTDASGNIRVLAAIMLGEMRQARAVPALLRSLGDEKWYVRQAVADALGKIGDRRAKSGLERASADGNAYVATAARRALAQISIPAKKSASKNGRNKKAPFVTRNKR